MGTGRRVKAWGLAGLPRARTLVNSDPLLNSKGRRNTKMPRRQDAKVGRIRRADASRCQEL
eukprot:5900222-Prorocentrum_lima.AAC.1